MRTGGACTGVSPGHADVLCVCWCWTGGASLSAFAKGLSAALGAMSAPDLPEQVEACLTSMTQVSRFDVTAMLLSAGDKAILRGVFDSLTGASRDVNDLRRKYRL